MGQAQVAIVTGGSSGIGLETGLRLAKRGYRLGVIDMVERPADTPLPDDVAWAVADVSREDQVDAAVASIHEELGATDLLVNNAGITGSLEGASRCHESSADEWDKVMGVNVRGIFLAARAVLPGMLERGSGHIITVASAAGVAAFPGRCAYTTSKGAALMFAKSLAADYAALGIRSNAICPGYVHTPMTDWRLQDDELRAALEAKIPIGRVAQPGEIADAICAMADTDFAYLNGHALLLDGGWTAV